jgi:DNA polymerase III delta subunit
LLAGDKAPARKIVEAVRAVGRVEVAGPDLSGSPSKRRKARNAWLAKHAHSEAERLGAELPPPVARFLVERVAEERIDGVSGVLDIAGEVGKLVAYAGGEPIDEQMVRVVTPEHPGARAFEFVDAITAGDAPRALGLLQDMASGAHPVSPERIQVALARHFRAVRRAQALGPSPSPDEVSEVTGLSGWPATKVAKQAGALAPPVVSSALIRTAALELDLRVGSLRHAGRKPEDGERLILERASRDLLDTFRRDDP